METIRRPEITELGGRTAFLQVADTYTLPQVTEVKLGLRICSGTFNGFILKPDFGLSFSLAWPAFDYNPLTLLVPIDERDQEALFKSPNGLVQIYAFRCVPRSSLTFGMKNIALGELYAMREDIVETGEIAGARYPVPITKDNSIAAEDYRALLACSEFEIIPD